MAGRVGRVLVGYVRRRITIYLFVLVVFATGTAFGAVAERNIGADERAALADYIHGFLGAVPDTPPPRQALARQAMLDYLIKTAGVMWLLGLSVIGAPLVVAVVFLRGFVLGFTAAFLINELVLRGVLLTLVSLVPHHILVVPAVLVIGAAAVSFSLTALRVLLGRRDANIYHQFLTSTFLTAAGSVVLVLAALVETYVTPVLMDAAARYLL